MKKIILILAVVVGILGACTSKDKGETQKISVGNQIIEDLSNRYTSKAYNKTKRGSTCLSCQVELHCLPSFTLADLELHSPHMTNYVAFGSMKG